MAATNRASLATEGSRSSGESSWVGAGPVAEEQPYFWVEAGPAGVVWEYLAALVVVLRFWLGQNR